MDRINIVEPNGVERTRPIPLEGLTIGRGTDNNIVLGYEEVSRYHATITFNGKYYEVTDLDSANGTVLGNQQLAAHTPVLWQPNTPLIIGGVTMRLLAGQRSTAAIPVGQGRSTTETIYWSGGAETQAGASRRTTVLLVLGVAALLGLCAAGGAVVYWLLF